MAARAKQIAAMASRIFGTSPNVLGPARHGARSGAKIFAKKPIGDAVNAWYPSPLRYKDATDPAYTYVDPLVINQTQKLIRLRRRGKGPPKKGSGKRVTKRR